MIIPFVDACVSAGGREGHPAPEREAGPVQEAGGALGTRTGEVSVTAIPEKRGIHAFVCVNGNCVDLLPGKCVPAAKIATEN